MSENGNEEGLIDRMQMEACLSEDTASDEDTAVNLDVASRSEQILHDERWYRGNTSKSMRLLGFISIEKLRLDLHRRNFIQSIHCFAGIHLKRIYVFE